MKDELVTLERAAIWLGTTRHGVLRLVCNGDLKATRVARGDAGLRLSRVAVERLLNSQVVGDPRTIMRKRERAAAADLEAFKRRAHGDTAGEDGLQPC